jgi:hypothetical protein
MLYFVFKIWKPQCFLYFYNLSNLPTSDEWIGQLDFLQDIVLLRVSRDHVWFSIEQTIKNKPVWILDLTAMPAGLHCHITHCCCCCFTRFRRHFWWNDNCYYYLKNICKSILSTFDFRYVFQCHCHINLQMLLAVTCLLSHQLVSLCVEGAQWLMWNLWKNRQNYFFVRGIYWFVCFWVFIVRYNTSLSVEILEATAKVAVLFTSKNVEIFWRKKRNKTSL